VGEKSGAELDGAGAPVVGATIDGRYVVEGVAGRGTSGVVLRVRHRETGRPLALKLLASGARNTDRFRREAQALGRLEHPSIVDVTDYGIAPELGGRPYLVMEYVEGNSLREALSAPVEREVVFEWLAAIADAVDHAHSKGVLHRDLKPENVILCPVPGRGVVPKVLDFGLARWWGVETESPPDERSAGAPGSSGQGHVRATDGQMLIGTPAYVSPEQILGNPVGPGSDIYALGIIAYELLTGRRPFEGSVLAVLDAHLKALPPQPALSGELATAVVTALAKDSAARPTTARAYVDNLRAADRGDRDTAAKQAARPRRLLLATVTAVITVASSGWLADTPWVQSFERRTRDWRWGLVPTRAPDPRVLLVPIDEDSLARDPRPLAEWGPELAGLMSRALDSGAAGIGIDLLMPRQFGESTELVQILSRDDRRVVLAALADPGGNLIGGEWIDAAVRESLGSQRLGTLFGLANVAEDVDGVSRKALLRFTRPSGADVPSFAARIANLLDPNSAPEPAGQSWLLMESDLRHRELERVPWHEAYAMAAHTPERFRGRVLLIGAEWSGSSDSQHIVVSSGERVQISGLELQALLVASALSPKPATEVPARLPRAASALLVAGLAATASWWRRSAWLALLWTWIALYTGVCVLCFFQSRDLLPLAAPLSSALVGTLAGLTCSLLGNARHSP
jgi:serine/threonine protein kinase